MSLGREAHEGFGRTILLILLLTSFSFSCFIPSPNVGAPEQPWTWLGLTPDAPAVTEYNPPSGPPYLIVYLAARGMDNSIWYRSKVDTGDWSDWIQVPGFTDARVAICAFVHKLCFVCKQVGVNRIWYGYYPCSGGLVSGSFSGWTLLDGFTPGAVSLARDTDYSTYMYMAARGMDDSIWYRWMNTDSNAWSGWAKIPGYTDVSPAIGHLAITGSPYRRLYFVCKQKASNNIWFGYLTIYPDFPFACVWEGEWAPLSGLTPDALTFATFSPAGSTKNLAARGMDNLIWYRYIFPDGTWSNWKSPGGYTSSPVGITNCLFDSVGYGIWFVARQAGTNNLWAKWHSCAA